MLATNKLRVFYAILVAIIAQAQCSDFHCYVCDNCAKVTKDTPKKICDETYFDNETTLTPMMSTDATTTTTQTTTTTTAATTTIAAKQPPTTTTTSATPPNPVTSSGPIQIETATLNETTTQAAVTETPTTFNSNNDTLQTAFLNPVNISLQPADIVMRQKRAVNETAFTYHCYSLRQSVNNTTVTSRGCTRISPKEDACTKLGQEYNTTKNSGCTACSNTLCNSSSSLAAPLVVMFLGLMAALVLRTTA